MTRLLAFDTSTELMSIALCHGDGDGDVLLFEGAGGAEASARLLPEIDALLARGGITLRQLDAIGFGRGPGAFTGLRSACAVAQGLALGAGKPVLPLDSLLLVAMDALAQRGDEAGPRGGFDVWVAMDARIDEIYAGRFRAAGGRWTTVSPPELTRPEALNARWDAEPPSCVAGSALPVFGARLHCAGALQFPAQRSRAAALARLVRQAWHDGAAVDAALALPVYLRDKVALTSAERAAARVAAA